MISKRPLLSRATQTTARNRPTYLRNSGPLIWCQPVFSAIDVRMVVWPSPIVYVPLAPPRTMVRPLCASGVRSLGSARSLDHLVGGCQNLGWNFEPECPGGLEVDRQLETGRLLHRQVGRLGALKNPVNIGRGALELIQGVD